MSKYYIYNDEYVTWDHLHNTLGFSETESYSIYFLSSDTYTFGENIESGYYTYTNKTNVNTYSYFVSGTVGWFSLNNLLTQCHLIPSFAKSTTVTKNGTSYRAYYFNITDTTFYFYVEGTSYWKNKSQLISDGYELPSFPDPVVQYRTYVTEPINIIFPKGYVNVSPNEGITIYNVNSPFQPDSSYLYGISKWEILSFETRGGLDWDPLSGKIINISKQNLSVTTVCFGYCLYNNNALSITTLYNITTGEEYTAFVYNHFGTKYYHILTGTGSVWSTNYSGYSLTRDIMPESFTADFAFHNTTPVSTYISTGIYDLYDFITTKTPALSESKEVFLPWSFVFLNSSGTQVDPSSIVTLTQYGLVNNTDGNLVLSTRFSSGRISSVGIKYYKMIV